MADVSTASALTATGMSLDDEDDVEEDGPGEVAPAAGLVVEQVVQVAS